MTPADRAHRDAAALDRDIALERAKRILVWGVLATVFVGGFLLFAWRASRLVPTQCVVQPTPNGGYCTVAHVTADGAEHTLPWERCDAPTRWPRGDVGTKLQCWFYPSFPSDIVFTPRAIAWMTPARGAALALSLALFVSGLVMAMRARRRPLLPETSAVGRAAYRVADGPPASERADVAPLVIPLRHSPGWLGWVIALPFALIGVVLLGLALFLSWQTTGEIGVVGVVLIAVAMVVPSFGFAGIGYRSGLVADQQRDRLTIWWGLWRPWFYSHYALSSLGHVGVHVVRTSRASFRRLQLRFKSGKARNIDCDDDVDSIVDRLKAYLARPGVQ